MIKNKKQELLTKEKIEELTQIRKQASINKEVSEIEKLYTLNSLDGMIATLQEELEEYNNLREGNLRILKAKSLQELPIVIIKTRIALGMSQTDLANKLNIQAQQVQRYEANDYQQISFDRLINIAEILGIDLSFKDTIIIGNGPKFEIPSNINEEQIEKAEKLVLEHGSIVM